MVVIKSDSFLEKKAIILARLQKEQKILLCLTQCPYSWNGTTYTTSGIYTYVTTNTSGCDSTEKNTNNMTKYLYNAF